MDGGGPQQRGAQGGAPHQQASLIRPEQVARLPQLNEQQKQQYTAGVRKFWEILNGSQQGDQRYNEAYQRLVQTSQTLMQGMKNFQMQAKQRQAQQQQAQAAQQAQQQAQQAQAASRQGGAQPGQNNGVAFTALSDDIQAKVNARPFILPPQMSQGSKQAEDWLREAKARYGQALQRMSVARSKKAEFERQYQMRTSSGNPLNTQEHENYTAKVNQCNKAIAESSNFMEKFTAQQNEFRSQQPQNMFQAQQGAGDAGGAEQAAVTANSAASNMQPGVQGPPAHSIATAVSAAANARNQQAGAGQPGQAGSPNANAPANLMQANASATPIKTESAQPFTQQPPHPSDPGSAGPRPVSQAGSAPPSALQQHPSQSSIHAHPLNSSIGGPKTMTAQAITKNLQVSDPKQVQMPPSRPTLNGGAGVGLPGQLGQPAITTLPGYVLESSEDGKLLSKKKLLELVREVCGPGPGEPMSPEAEEVNHDRGTSRNCY